VAKIKKHFNQSTMSLLFYVILFYIIFLPLYLPLLLRFKWWDRSIDEINRLIPILTCSDLDKVKAEIKKQLG
ncbi:MAG: hypothetical protein KH085_14220, partial [Clostridiales bacterium]|nr:hypothetical protein [Clostridiales bacterium]